MAASSSAKFFVHQNQNKANSSSAASALAAESCDVVEFIEFPELSKNEDPSLENYTAVLKNINNNESNTNYRNRRSSTLSMDDLQRRLIKQVHNREEEEAAAATNNLVPSVLISSPKPADTAGAAANQIECVDIEEAISTVTPIITNSGESNQAGNLSRGCKLFRPPASNNLCNAGKGIRNSESEQHRILLHQQQHNNSASLSLQSRELKSISYNEPITILNPTQIIAELARTQAQRKQTLSSLELTASVIKNLTIQQQQQNQQPSFASSIRNIRTPFLKSAHTAIMNSSQPTQAAQPGNRITFTSQTLPNGTINIGGGHSGGAGSTIISTAQLPNTTTIKTIAAGGAGGAQHHGLPQQVQVQHHQVLQAAQQHQQGQTGTGQGSHQQQQHHQQHNAQSVGATQTQTLVIKSNHAVSLPAGLVSSAPGIVTMTKTINHQGNQPLLNSMLPANVVVGMRPPNSQQQQKSVQGNALGRVVIGGPHMVGTRPQSPAITLSALTPGQTPALILKTENGFQLLRVGTATSSPVTQTIGTNSTNPTQIRLQTVPAAVSRFAGPPIALRKTIVRSSSSTTTTTTTHQQQQQQHQQQQAITTKQTKQNSMAATSSSNNIIVNSVASTNSSPHVVYTSQANISLQQPQQQQTTSTISSIQQQHIQQQQQHQIHQQTQHLHIQPQITQIQTISPHQISAQQHQVNVTTMNNASNSSSGNNATTTGGTITTTTTTQQSTSAQGNTKEKCRKFLANLIDLSTREPKPVEKNVRNLIQELVNANVEPEEFCDRLERLLNASPQPCLIGFLKKSLPLLRQALFTKELIIEGIKPPPQHVVGMNALQHQLPRIQAQIRPISQNQTTTIGQTQVRMISPAAGGPRPIGHTTITKQPAGIRIQGPTNGPRLVNTTQIRGPIPATIQQQQPTSQMQTMSAQPNIVHIRAPTATHITRPATVQIRTTKGKNTTAGITHVKVGQTQIKAISSPTPANTSATTNQPPSLTAISNSIPPSPMSMSAASSLISSSSSSSSILSTINSVATNSIGPTLMGGSIINSLPTPSLPTVQLPPSIVSLSSNNSSVLPDTAGAVAKIPDYKLLDIKSEKLTPVMPIANRTTVTKSATSASKASSKKKKEQDKEKDEKTGVTISVSTAAAAAMTSFFQQPSISMSSTLYGDDDINDVAAMGGVNLAEESQRILGCTENIGTQIRSCKDEVFLHLPALQARIRAMVAERGLEEPSQDVAVLISHACQERLKNVVEKLAVIAEHRIDVIKLDPRYEVTKDVRGQIKFLEELDKAEQKRHEELEREMLLRAAKSRSKIEDPEQAKMKARAKEMQRAEMEELRQRDANMTALQAIGPRKKIKLDGDITGTGVSTNVSGALGTSSASSATLRPRIKRVNLRDMLFFMEQERETCRSQMLYKAYLK